MCELTFHGSDISETTFTDNPDDFVKSFLKAKITGKFQNVYLGDNNFLCLFCTHCDCVIFYSNSSFIQIRLINDGKNNRIRIDTSDKDLSVCSGSVDLGTTYKGYLMSEPFPQSVSLVIGDLSTIENSEVFRYKSLLFSCFSSDKVQIDAYPNVFRVNIGFYEDCSHNLRVLKLLLHYVGNRIDSIDLFSLMDENVIRFEVQNDLFRL